MRLSNAEDDYGGNALWEMKVGLKGQARIKLTKMNTPGAGAILRAASLSGQENARKKYKIKSCRNFKWRQLLIISN